MWWLLWCIDHSHATSSLATNFMRYAPGGALISTKNLIRQRRSFETYSPGRARSNKKRRCLIPLAEECQEYPGPARRSRVCDLPNELLIKIFGLLDPQLHRFVLPLVCRQWWVTINLPITRAANFWSLQSSHCRPKLCIGICLQVSNAIVHCQHSKHHAPFVTPCHIDCIFSGKIFWPPLWASGTTWTLISPLSRNK